MSLFICFKICKFIGFYKKILNIKNIGTIFAILINIDNRNILIHKDLCLIFYFAFYLNAKLLITNAKILSLNNNHGD